MNPIRAVKFLPIVLVAVYWGIRPAPIKEALPPAPATPVASSGNVAVLPDSDSVIVLNWRQLADLDYLRGAVPPALAQLNGRRVRLPGFIVPLEDFQETAREFLLVPYFGACVHTPPPPPNQMLFVRMKGGPKALSMWEPVWIEGMLKIATYDSPYGAVGFQMTGERITPYREE